VLRVAAEQLRKSHGHVHYFPSYEVISGHYTRGAYYADDLRSVVEEGVTHVMRLFLQHATAGGVTVAPAQAAAEPQEDSHTRMAREFVEVECDEVALDR